MHRYNNVMPCPHSAVAHPGISKSDGLVCSYCDFTKQVFSSHSKDNHFYYKSASCIICGHERNCIHSYHLYKCVYCDTAQPPCPDYQHEFGSNNDLCQLCNHIADTVPKCVINKHQYNKDNTCILCGHQRILEPLHIELLPELIITILSYRPDLDYATTLLCLATYKLKRIDMYHRYISKPITSDIPGQYGCEYVGVIFNESSCLEVTDTGPVIYEEILCAMYKVDESTANCHVITKKGHVEFYTEYSGIYSQRRLGGLWGSSEYMYDVVTCSKVVKGRLKRYDIVDDALAARVVINTLRHQFLHGSHGVKVGIALANAQILGVDCNSMTQTPAEFKVLLVRVLEAIQSHCKTANASKSTLYVANCLRTYGS